MQLNRPKQLGVGTRGPGRRTPTPLRTEYLMCLEVSQRQILVILTKVGMYILLLSPVSQHTLLDADCH